MNILRLAYSKAPKESIKIFTQIYKDDKKISSLAKKLTKLQMTIKREVVTSKIFKLISKKSTFQKKK